MPFEQLHKALIAEGFQLQQYVHNELQQDCRKFIYQAIGNKYDGIIITFTYYVFLEEVEILLVNHGAHKIAIPFTCDMSQIKKAIKCILLLDHEINHS